jgi:hypothetical protein
MQASSNMFPFPFTWVLNDFPSFILDPTCYEIFRDYLNSEEPSNLAHLKNIVGLFGEAKSNLMGTINGASLFKGKTTEETTISFAGQNSSLKDEKYARNLYNNSMNKLEKSYDSFRKTHAYLKLVKKIHEFEKITEVEYF